MPDDPLAQRHGSLIAQAWRLIAAARTGARRQEPPHGHLTRLRNMRKRVLDAHKAELLRSELSTRTIDQWFAEVEQVLAKADAYFRNAEAPRELFEPCPTPTPKQQSEYLMQSFPKSLALDIEMSP